MAIVPDEAMKAWDDRQGPVVLSTTNPAGIPNSIYVTCVKRISSEKIVIADNKLHKTRENIKAGSKVSLLYITPEKKAYQLKGTVEYLTSGEIYDDMKNGWLNKKFPGNAAVVFHVEEVYNGANKLA